GTLRSVDGNTPAMFILDPAEWPGGDTITSKIEVSDVGPGFDALVVGVLDSLGNGYRISVHNWGVQRHRLDTFTPYTGSGVEDYFTTADGDIFEVQYTKSTGEVIVRRNGVQLTACDLTDTTHADKVLAPYFGATPSDTGQGGLYAFAADLGESAGATGTGAITLPAFQVAGGGVRSLAGTGAITLPEFGVSGGGEREVEGAGAITLPALTVAGSGERQIPAAGAITLPTLEVAGAGEVSRVGGG